MPQRYIVLGMVLALAACWSTPAATLVAPSPVLLPLPGPEVDTPGAPTATAGQRPTPVIIASPTATATPVTHIVQAGETLLGIALQFGVSLAALQAANPTVSAQFLSIGTVLIIPPAEGGPAASAKLAPPPLAPVQLGEPVCYPLATNGLYCFVEARNPGAAPLENVSARIILADSQGLPLASAVAYAALDLIPPGKGAPLVALFQPAPSAVVSAVGLELLTANLATTPAPVGRAVPLDIASEHGGPLGARWAVAGQVRNPSNQALSTGWVMLALYDARGQIVGYRKHALDAGLPAGAALNFTIFADTLGGAVDHYALLAEGRP